MRWYKVIVITLVILLLNGCNKVPFDDSAIRYRIQASHFDLIAANSYPQEILTVHSSEAPYDITVRIWQNRSAIAPASLNVDYDYLPEVAIYLEPSTKAQSDAPEIIQLANTLAPKETDIIKIAQAVAKWTSKNIKYDENLARRMRSGNSDTQDAVTTIQTKQGTCGEYTNSFIAIMRSKGIPAKFVHGYCFGDENYGVFHAWAEIYIPERGWIPVDPQLGVVYVTKQHIKLQEGRDFVDIGVKFRDLNVKVNVVR